MQNLLKFFGSLKLAVVVLLLLAIGMATGTMLESRESGRVAAQVVYRSWWFNGLLALLAVNVASAALTRWPWKRRHIGFVITHAGIIILLGGCSAAFHYGTEGMMERRVGQPPANLVRIEDEALTVVVPETGVRMKRPLRVKKDGRIKPGVIQVAKDLRLTLDEFLPNTRVVQLVEERGSEPNPALQFQLKSEMAGQDVTDWLLAASPDHNRANLGPAQIEFVAASNADELKSLLAEPGRPDSSVGAPTVTIRVGGKDFGFDVAENAEKHLDLGDTGIGAHIVGYWPDFQLDEDHKPSTASDEPNNPAAVVILSRGDDEERHFVFADGQMAPIMRTTRGTGIGAQVWLSGGASKRRTGVMTVVLAADGTLHYAVAAKAGFKSGELKVGEPVATGWMDFQFTPVKYVANALVSERIEAASVDPEANSPAVKVTAHSGGQEQSEWVRFGQPAVLMVGGKTVHMMYSWDAMQLPFTVELEDFVVERDEGSMNVAGWTSKVIFRDDVRGLTQRASIWMNHPAWFNGYKFSQASWNPNDLKYTALQVKKDPMFVTYLTWAGAALIVSGIALMFWGRGWLQRKDEDGRRTADDRKAKELVTA